jgi:hypothetical protein
MVGYLPFGLGFEVAAETTRVAQKEKTKQKKSKAIA